MLGLAGDHIFNLSTQEAGAGGALSFWTAWATEWGPVSKTKEKKCSKPLRPLSYPKIYLYLWCVLCFYSSHVWRCLQKPEEGVRSLELESWVIPCGSWGLNFTPLEEQQVLLATEAQNFPECVLCTRQDSRSLRCLVSKTESSLRSLWAQSQLILCSSYRATYWDPVSGPTKPNMQKSLLAKQTQWTQIAIL